MNHNNNRGKPIWVTTTTTTTVTTTAAGAAATTITTTITTNTTKCIQDLENNTTIRKVLNKEKNPLN